MPILSCHLPSFRNADKDRMPQSPIRERSFHARNSRAGARSRPLYIRGCSAPLFDDIRARVQRDTEPLRTESFLASGVGRSRCIPLLIEAVSTHRSDPIPASIKKKQHPPCMLQQVFVVQSRPESHSKNRARCRQAIANAVRSRVALHPKEKSRTETSPVHFDAKPTTCLAPHATKHQKRSLGETKWGKLRPLKLATRAEFSVFGPICRGDLF